MERPKYDFFISHASEDKEIFVRPFAKELERRGYKIWYDELSLKIGDSLTQGISEGIKDSLYGIVVLSKNFFNKAWTKKELETLLNKEAIVKNNLVLPILLEINVSEVYEFSPLLADKISVSVRANELDKAIEAIEQKTEINKTTKVKIIDKIEYLKNCNDDRRNKYFLDLEKRIKSIFLFQEEYYNRYASDDLFEDDWDQVLIDQKEAELDQKENELKKEYDIPEGVWIYHEPYNWKDVERAIKLCSKWVFRKLNYEEALELCFLLEDYLDTDVPFILYGFPHSTLLDEEVHNVSMCGIAEVGIKDVKRRIVNEERYKNAIAKTYAKYYRS